MLFSKADIYVSFFAGYSSYLPGVFAKIKVKQHLIILGGTDCVSFPEIGYGNFQKQPLGWFTRKSLEMATHLAPVDEKLVLTDYTYISTTFKQQGYKVFAPKTDAPHTTINIGYNSEKFKCAVPKKPNSFLTVAQMNKPNFFRKGIDLIFELAIKFPECTFTVVGNTPQMVYEFVPSNVELKSFVPYEKLNEEYSSHEFYLQLSIMEGFPSAPCEAMLCECIPIVSNVGALETIVGDAGFILKEKNLDALTVIMHQALSSKKIELGKKARSRIIEKFPMETREALIRLINRLLQSVNY